MLRAEPLSCASQCYCWYIFSSGYLALTLFPLFFDSCTSGWIRYFIRTLHPFSLCEWDTRNNKTVREVFQYSDIRLNAAVKEDPGLEIHGGANVIYVNYPNMTGHSEPFYLSTFHTKSGDGVYTNYLVEFETALPFRISRISRALPLLRAPVRDSSVDSPMAFASGLAVIRPDPSDPQRYNMMLLLDRWVDRSIRITRL
jgi:hypothetical protein